MRKLTVPAPLEQGPPGGPACLVGSFYAWFLMAIDGVEDGRMGLRPAEGFGGVRVVRLGESPDRVPQGAPFQLLELGLGIDEGFERRACSERYQTRHVLHLNHRRHRLGNHTGELGQQLPLRI